MAAIALLLSIAMGLDLDHYPAASDVTVVTLRGDLSISTSPKLRSLLVELADSGRVRLVLDLSRLEFIDSTGLGVMVGALKRARGQQPGPRVVSLVIAEDRILKPFKSTGLVKMFPIFDNVPGAVAYLLGSGEPADQQAARMSH